MNTTPDPTAPDSHVQPTASALHGIRVLDLSRVLAGPWCTQTLADLGADVIKVERPGSGDDTRAWGPPFLADTQGKDTAEAAYYLGANRNKRSITCDFSQPAGQQLIRELVSHCHVFVENFKVGDMARYGLDFATLKALNPALVYCSITGYGQTGPTATRRVRLRHTRPGWADERHWRARRPARQWAQKVGVAVADLFTGMYATVAVLAALRHAERTGQGQHIDMALLDTQVAMLANLGANYLVRGQADGKVPGRMGNAHANIVPYQVFEVAPDAAGQPQHVILAVGNDSQFAKFCAVAGHPEWATDPRFATNAQRVRNRADLVPQLEASLKTRTKAEWLSALDEAKVPCGPINNLAEVFADPRFNSAAWSNTGHIPTHPTCAWWPAPQTQRHATHLSARRPCWASTREVLTEVLGLDDNAITALAETGAISPPCFP